MIYSIDLSEDFDPRSEPIQSYLWHNFIVLIPGGHFICLSGTPD